MNPRPTARSIVLCEEIVPDPLNPKRVSLLRVINAIAPKQGARYPVLQEQLDVFAQITEGRGEGLIWVQVVHADSETTIFRTKVRTVNFPGQPLLLHGLQFRIKRLPFSEPGLFWIQMWFNNGLLIQTPLLLRPAAHA